MLIRKRKTGAVWECDHEGWTKVHLGHNPRRKSKPVGYHTPYIRLDNRFEVLKDDLATVLATAHCPNRPSPQTS